MFSALVVDWAQNTKSLFFLFSLFFFFLISIGCSPNGSLFNNEKQKTGLLGK